MTIPGLEFYVHKGFYAGCDFKHNDLCGIALVCSQFRNKFFENVKMYSNKQNTDVAGQSTTLLLSMSSSLSPPGGAVGFKITIQTLKKKY